MDAILRWVALALAAILNKFGDPTLQAKLDAYNAKVAETEAREREAGQAALASEAAYQTSVNRRAELDRLLQANIAEENALERELAESQLRLKQIQDEADKAKKDLDSRSDSDVLRDRL